MAEGLVTFFKYKELGFYKRGGDYHEPLDMDSMLDSLMNWYESRTSLADTLPWNGHAEFRKKVYLKSIRKDHDTGDYLVTLWRAVGDGNGVYGISSKMAPKDAEVINAEDSVTADSVIWGEPAYYWFIPSLCIFASIKFTKSIADTYLMNLFLRKFIEIRSDLPNKVVEEAEHPGSNEVFTRIYFKPQNSDEDANLWFRIASEQFIKLTNEADLSRIASEITHFVSREVISTSVVADKDWTRLFKNLPYISSEITKNSRQVEVTVDAAPTGDQLRELFETYNDKYNPDGYDKWSNLGFKKEGIGGVFWLNQFIVKNHLTVDETGSGYYKPETLFAALNIKRASLLAPFTTIENESALTG